MDARRTREMEAQAHDTEISTQTLRKQVSGNTQEWSMARKYNMNGLRERRTDGGKPHIRAFAMSEIRRDTGGPRDSRTVLQDSSSMDINWNPPPKKSFHEKLSRWKPVRVYSMTLEYTMLELESTL